ncbi:MAG: RsmD family RNA methyltransferase [Patescibacteria group bacterium]|nr:RsmD family RNA methyltransferase [Patescibacteria group bacterium]
MRKGKWYIDDYLPNTWTMHRIRREIVRKKTKYQLIEIMDLFDFGRSLFIDGNPQSCEGSEWMYHECLVHPAMLLGPDVKKKTILVLGAGEGATARELLKYRNVSDVTLVDVDEEAMKIFKKFLPMMHKNSFSHSKVKIVIDSASDFLKKNQEEYDVIISDITDCNFFSLGTKISRTEKDFYSLIAARLKKDGLFATHAGDLNEDEHKTHVRLRKFMKKIYPSVYSYKAYIPFLENEWGFLIASQNKGFNPKKFKEKIIQKRILKCGIEKKLDYISPEILKAAFIFSPRLEKIFQKY